MFRTAANTCCLRRAKKHRGRHGAHWNAEGCAPCVSVRNKVLNRYVLTIEYRGRDKIEMPNHQGIITI